MDKKILILLIMSAAVVFLLFNSSKDTAKIPPANPELPDLSGLPEVPSEVQKEARENLSRIKVASQYRYVSDGQAIGRSLEDTINIFKDTKTDFIFQGWLTQQPLPDKCSDLSVGDKKKCEAAGYSYEYLINSVSGIKKAMPEALFSGGTQFEYFYPEEVSANGDAEQRDKAWEMALNPAKWGLDATRKDMQCYWAKRWALVEKNEPCPNEEYLKTSMRYYFPDVTNADFQKLFLSRIFRQIDAGADAIWIDMLYVQPALLAELAKDENHPAVRESYAAIRDIVDKIHKYGYSKGKYVYVITWVAQKEPGSIIVIPKTNVDIAVLSFAPNEIKDKSIGKIGQFDEKLWDDAIRQIREKLDLPIFVRIDYGGGGRTPFGVFSQELTASEAGEFLKKADEFLAKKGVTFIYPVHGGDMGLPEKVKKLSYGKYNWYDSLAPEFDTYGIIKELANKKAEN